jgi:hypothetical protein
MSDAKKKQEIETLIEALDDVPIDEAEGREATKRLGIDVKKLAGSIRDRIAVADGTDRARRFDDARQVYREHAARYDAKPAEPRRSAEEQRAIVRSLVARVPRESAPAVANFHKFEQATEEELAEMIKALRHLLNEDEK